MADTSARLAPPGADFSSSRGRMHRILPATPSSWPLHDVASSRLIEQHAQPALPPHSLMQRAGTSVARLALALAPHARCIWVVCGPGNNGGDGLEAAAHLHAAGRDVRISLLADPTQLPSDAAASLQRAQAAGVPIAAHLHPPDGAGRGDLAIDALLGLGATRAPGGALAEAVSRLRGWPGRVLCVDLPTGLDADTGQPLGEGGDAVVRGDHTLSLLTLKPGLFTGAGRDFAGQVWFDDLQVEASEPACASLFAPDPALEPLARRHAQHKGSFGDVLVMGGAAGMAGAALLAGRAALAAGAGRVYVHVLGGTTSFDAAFPELMFRDESAAAAMDWASLTVACGCGGGTQVRGVLPRALSQAGRLLLDADALNAIAADPMLQSLLEARGRRGTPTVLTPHPLEAARLLGAGAGAAAVQRNRLQAAQDLSGRYGSVVVLKGSGTVVCAPRAIPSINPTGNAALASPGTGDVLAGWLAGRWSQGIDAFLAARLGVHTHGAAADRWAATHGLTGPLTAGRLIDLLVAG